MSSIDLIILVLAYVSFWLLLSEFLSRKDMMSKNDARKLLHISVGAVVLFIPLFDDRFIVTLIPIGFIFFNYFLTPYGPIKRLRMHTFEAGHGFGTVWYALGLAILVLVSYDSPWKIVACFFPVAFGDGLAAVIGSRAKSGFIIPWSGKKSLLGLWVFIWASFVSVVFGMIIVNDFSSSILSLHFILLVAVVVAVLGAIIELLSLKGMDNFFIPVVLFIILEIVSSAIASASGGLNLSFFIVGLMLALLFGVFGFFSKILTLDGAMGGSFLGMVIMGIGGITFGLGLLAFFLVGTLATRIGHKSKAQFISGVFEKASVKRDSAQAIAKASFPAFMSFLMPFFQDSPYISMVFIAAMGASLADTMGTEIGVLSKEVPRSVLRPWKKAAKGESGAISIVGSLASMVTALLFSLLMVVSILIDPSIDVKLPPNAIIIAAGAAFLGMFFDSALGSTLQEQRICEECEKKVESRIHHDKPTVYFSGLRNLNNETINFVSTTTTGIISGLLFLLF